jgi:hypothetical protein
MNLQKSTESTATSTEINRDTIDHPREMLAAAKSNAATACRKTPRAQFYSAWNSVQK